MDIKTIEELITLLNEMGYSKTVGLFKAKRDGIITYREYDYIRQYYMSRSLIVIIGIIDEYGDTYEIEYIK